MQIHFSRVLVGLIIGGLLSFVMVLSVVDFSVVEVDLETEFPVVADYIKLQADNRDTLAYRDIGQKEAPIKLTLYTDFACDSCKGFYDQIWPWVRFALIDRNIVRFELRFYPLLNTHKESLTVAQASLCAAEQQDFSTYSDLLFDKQDEWRQNTALTDYLINLAKNNRYRESTFRTCLLSGKYEQFVRLELSDAIDKGITGAPTVVLEYEDQRRVIEGALTVGKYEQEINDLLEMSKKEEESDEAELEGQSLVDDQIVELK